MKMKYKQITDALVLLLLLVFAVSLISVLFMGVNAYSRLTERDSASYSQRTCVQYIVTRVHSNDRTGAVSIDDFGDGDALVMRETIGDREYMTRLYFYDGYLTELFSPSELSFTPDSGERIMEISDLSFSFIGDGLLNIVCVEKDGIESSISVSLRSEGGTVK